MKKTFKKYYKVSYFLKVLNFKVLHFIIDNCGVKYFLTVAHALAASFAKTGGFLNLFLNLFFILRNSHILTKVIISSESGLKIKVSLPTTLFFGFVHVSSYPTFNAYALKRSFTIPFELQMQQTSLNPFSKRLTKFYKENKNCSSSTPL